MAPASASARVSTKSGSKVSAGCAGSASDLSVRCRPAAAPATNATKRKRLASADDVVSPNTEDELEGLAPDATDNANYFCEYAYLYHQMDMLEDGVRTGTYQSAILKNPRCFAGKVVLDVGAGTGILAMMAARAGAKQVFAVEATDMSEFSKRIVEANGLSDKVRVIRGTIETVTLPCKVDVIISEWMGYMLLRESMLDSVLFARDAYLKPGGSLFPSHATLFLAPVARAEVLRDKRRRLDEELAHWSNFVRDMKKIYRTDYSCVRGDYEREQRKHFLQTSSFVELHPHELAGPGAALLDLDLLSLTMGELQEPGAPCKCTLSIERGGDVEGFCGYFDTAFRGSPEHPVSEEIVLHTAPHASAFTHWGQQAFGFYPSLKAARGDVLECVVWIHRQAHNHRLLRLEGKFSLYSMRGGKRTLKDSREGQYYVN